MRFNLTLRVSAEADLRAAYDWYDSKRAGLGSEFLRHAADAFVLLEESADRHPPYYRELRRVILRRFPYKVFYLIKGDDVIVFRVLHAAMDHPRQFD